jgi:hypothetical protein
MGLPCKTASCFQLGVRFPDGTLQTTAATTTPPSPPAGLSGDIQFNNGGVFGGETLVPLANGGTNANLSATGGASQVLKQSSVGAPITVGLLLAGDIPNIAESQVTNLTADLAAKVSTSTTVNGHALSSNVIVSASDLTTGTLSPNNGGVATGSLGAILSCLGSNIWQITTSETAVAGPSTSANQVFVFQFILPHSITINKIVYSVTTLSASDKWGFGIYSSDGLTKLVDSGAVSPTATGTAFSVTIGAVTLPPGTYYFAQTSSGTTAQMNFFPSNTAQMFPIFNLNRSRTGLGANASVAGVLPSTIGAISTATIRDPMLVLFEN